VPDGMEEFYGLRESTVLFAMELNRRVDASIKSLLRRIKRVGIEGLLLITHSTSQ
jgi:hypothetical protein